MTPDTDAELRALRTALMVERGINADLREELAKLRADVQWRDDACDSLRAALNSTTKLVRRQGEQIEALTAELKGRAT